jgi:protein-disulfide isomerase
MSLVGAAYFLGLAAGLIAGRGVVGRAWARMVFIGAAWSLVMIGGLLQLGHLCPWCLLVHGANLLLAALVVRQFGSAASSGPRWQMAGTFAAGVVALAALVVGESGVRNKARDQAERALTDSTRQIVSGIQGTNPDQGFAGRFRLGPEVAPVRVVVFTDFQCPDCRMVDLQIDELTARYPQLAVSVRVFPLNTDCNPHAPGRRHANACWAARAALAAGQVDGTSAYWRMHRWLFARGGAFTEPELLAALPTLGLDRAAFIPVMESQGVGAQITQDIELGMSLGIMQTPMVFINGVELKGWNAERAVTRAVEAAIEAAPPPASALADRPMDAPSKFVADWRESPRRNIDPRQVRHSTGPEGSPVRVVLIGDYREGFTAEADGLLRLFTTGPEPNIRYSFVHYPVDQSCNPVAEMTRHADACRAAMAAEAAGAVGGDEGFWAMHGWLMRNQRTPLDNATLRAAAVEVGLDPDLLLDALAQPFVQENVAADARLAASLGLQSIPMIFVNERHAARWKHEAENVLARMIAEAAGR